MTRNVIGACAVVFFTLTAMGPTPVAAPDSRGLPMRFDVRVEGPASVCGKDCRTLVSATGAITAETPREFETFAQRNNIRGATLILDSDGGSVLGALALGRAIRAQRMTTTVGKLVDVPAVSGVTEKRARLQARAYCESMCAFVLIAGVERYVPAEARVLVHQIWLGDRREDPTAANYSAEDLVLVQRDIGRLAQYTIEMGGTIDLLEIALKIPPWEPMRLLSRDELRGMKIVTFDDGPEISSGAATTASTLSNGSRVSVNERSWIIGDNAGRAVMTRKHPLTVEGDDIGNFELTFTCGEPGKDLVVTYSERRRSGDTGRVPEALTDVGLSLSGKSVPLKVVSSRPSDNPLEFESVASGHVPAELFRTFADTRSRSLMIETTSNELATAIRVGNSGVARGYLKFAASCGDQVRTRSTELRPGG